MTITDMSAVRDDFHLRWPTIQPPLRPAAQVVEGMRVLLAGRSGDSLQLGVTPEIAHLSSRGLAIDHSEGMISLAWPGDTETHKAIIGNWLAMPLRAASVDTAFGDGCLSMLGWPHEYRLFLQNIQHVMRPGGRLLLRCFVGPDDAETVETVAAAALAGQGGSFSAFKLRLNMAAFRSAAGAANTGEHIHRLFQQYLPDRERLSRAAGWTAAEIASIDAYAGGLSVHSYPTRADIVSLLPAQLQHGFVETADYPLAERCPLLVVDFPAG